MARRRTSAVTVVRAAPASAAPIIRVAAPRAHAINRVRAAGRRAARRIGASGALTPITAALVSAGVGYAEKSGLLDVLPTVPAIGRKGTLAVAAYFWSRAGGGKMARDVAVVASALAGYEFGKMGSVSGDYSAEEY